MTAQELENRAVAPVGHLEIGQVVVNRFEDALVAIELGYALFGRPRVHATHRDRILVGHPGATHVFAQRFLVGHSRLVHEIGYLGQEFG